MTKKRFRRGGWLALLTLGAINLVTAVTLAQPKMSGPRNANTTNENLPLNRFQFIGTHNSYHIAPSAKLLQFIEAFQPGQGAALNYSYPPLREQLDRLGIRHLELDLYADPHGGLYANPISARLPGEKPTPTDPALQAPGFKILHSPDFDTNTNVASLRLALRELRAWSQAHPTHEPVFVQLEMKIGSYSALKPLPIDKAALLSLEAEIRAGLPAAMILTPDEVRGTYPTLREAVTSRGWPTLAHARGKFIFGLDNEDAIRDHYLELSPHQDLQGRLIFVSVPPTHPAAAWMKRNEALTSFDDIRSLVSAGFMVRTRADADLKEIIANDPARRDAAMASGAQWISTDAPEPNPLNPNYHVAWPKRAIYRLDPVVPKSKIAGIPVVRICFHLCIEAR